MIILVLSVDFWIQKQQLGNCWTLIELFNINFDISWNFGHHFSFRLFWRSHWFWKCTVECPYNKNTQNFRKVASISWKSGVYKFSCYNGRYRGFWPLKSLERKIWHANLEIWIQQVFLPLNRHVKLSHNVILNSKTWGLLFYVH